MVQADVQTPRPRLAVVVGATGGLGTALVDALLAREDVDRVLAAGRSAQDPEGPLAARAAGDGRLRTLALDVTAPGQVEALGEALRDEDARLVMAWIAPGLLHDAAHGVAPEKRLEQVELAALERVFAVNAFGPLLVARQLVPRLRRGERTALAFLSARVGSIADNRKGGWYAYRASKAALNQMVRSLAVELRRRAPEAFAVALHPGTVATPLSAPFRDRVAHRVTPPPEAARNLLDVVDGLGPAQSGGFYAYDGTEIPW